MNVLVLVVCRKGMEERGGVLDVLSMITIHFISTALFFFFFFFFI